MRSLLAAMYTRWFSYEPYAFKWKHGSPDPEQSLARHHGTTPMTPPAPPRRPRRPLPPTIRRRHFVELLLGLPLVALPSGCSVLGLAAHAMPLPPIPARYNGLAGHSVAVLVWVPRGLEVDYPALRLDLVSGIQTRLQRAQKAGKGRITRAGRILSLTRRIGRADIRAVGERSGNCL